MPSSNFRLGRTLAALTLLLASTVAPGPSAIAAAYPDKPIRLVVPFTPGGGTDLIARTMALAMAEDLGQPVIIDNKPGAGTIIGSSEVAKSAPDGYTVLMATTAHVTNPMIHAKLPYTADAFSPVMLVGRSPTVLVARSSSPYKTVQGLIAAAREKPGKLNYATQGSGTSAHLAGELFKALARVDLVHIAYRGAGPALNDLLSGQVDVMFGSPLVVGPHLENGKLRAIAVTGAQRSVNPKLADLPTVAEGGLSGYVVESWYGLLVPAGTPASAIARLNASARKAVQAATFRRHAGAEGLIAGPGTPEDFERYMREEDARWSSVIRKAGITTQ